MSEIIRLEPKNRLASITNQNPTLEQAVDSIRSAVANLTPASLVSCTVAALRKLAEGAEKSPEAADAVAAIRTATEGAKPYAYRQVTVEILAVLKAGIEAPGPAAPEGDQADGAEAA